MWEASPLSVQGSAFPARWVNGSPVAQTPAMTTTSGESRVMTRLDGRREPTSGTPDLPAIMANP